MSSLVVRATLIGDIRPHPNAERLELAQIGGWQCVVPKGQYRAGDMVVYFPPDTLLPKEWADRFGVTKYLSFSKPSPDMGRIRCARLRGEPSFGLVVDPADSDWEPGQDVAVFYGAQKYIPPVRVTAGDAAPDHPLFPRYTEVENLRNFPDVLQEGEPVVVTEKIHGTNCRVAVVWDEAQETNIFMAGSHRLNRKMPGPGEWERNTYWFPLTLPSVRELLTELGQGAHSIVLYGEVYGRGIQSLQYGESGLAFAAFDLLLNGWYLDHRHPGVLDFSSACAQFKVPTVPILYEGPYSLAKVRELASGKTTLGGAHLKEGVVVRPLRERTDPRVGRVILKYISDEYLLSQQEDNTDR